MYDFHSSLVTSKVLDESYLTPLSAIKTNYLIMSIACLYVFNLGVSLVEFTFSSALSFNAIRDRERN